MSVTQFSVRLVLQDEAYADTEDYEQLPMDYPANLTLQRAYRTMYGQEQYEPGVSKAICLSQSAYRYIHAVLSRSVNGHGGNTGVLSCQELLYLSLWYRVSHSTWDISWLSICINRGSMSEREFYSQGHILLESLWGWVHWTRLQGPKKPLFHLPSAWRP